MPRYRSKPVEIEATQFTGSGSHPKVHPYSGPETRRKFECFSRQGWVQVDIGDWIIAESDGSGHYPCKPDVFEAKYERI